VTLTGEPIATPGDARQGMLMDFSEVRAIAQREIVDVWDHAFLAWREDRLVLEFLSRLPQHRTVVFDQPPTAEHLALAAFTLLERAYTNRYGNGLKLERVRLYETPNCWADCDRTAG
jgi:6-pyruvoyltetrahydropterin/6-carboxytetrahydropterin synthase